MPRTARRESDAPAVVLTAERLTIVALGAVAGWLLKERRRLIALEENVSDAAPALVMRGGLELLATVEEAVAFEWDQGMRRDVEDEAEAYRAVVDEHIVIAD